VKYLLVANFAVFCGYIVESLEVQLRGEATEICECNLNQDNACDNRDFVNFGAHWGRTDCNDPGAEFCECDLDGNGVCDNQDFVIFGGD
jgi:hypothetical protein